MQLGTSQASCLGIILIAPQEDMIRPIGQRQVSLPGELGNGR
jgi:hypothetical protein